MNSCFERALQSTVLYFLVTFWVLEENTTVLAFHYSSEEMSSLHINTVDRFCLIHYSLINVKLCVFFSLY